MRVKYHRGFTLIEIMISLSIVSIAILALSKSMFENARVASQQQERLFASWVASNEIADAKMHLKLRSSGFQKNGSVHLGNAQWRYTIQTESHVEHNNSVVLSVRVFDESEKPLTQLKTYYYRAN